MAQTKVKQGLLQFTDNTDYLQLPVGTTAQRPVSPAEGYTRFNTTEDKIEFFDGIKWVILGVDQPTIDSITYPGDDTAADPAGGQTVLINGTNFAAGATVTIDGEAPASVSITETQITITTNAKAAGDYDIVVTNLDGTTVTSVNGISYNGIPAWTTTAGSLGSFNSGSSIGTITLVAAEPDSGAIVYSITSGALPTGVSLNSSTGELTGNVPSVTNLTVYNFTVTATDNENQSTPRSFSIEAVYQSTSVVDIFDDGSGIALYQLNWDASDLSGNYDGTTTDISFVNGKFNSAGSFNGSSSYVSLPSILNIDTQRVTFSVSLWIKIKTPKVAGIFNDYHGTGGYNIVIEGQSDGTIKVFNNLGGGIAMSTPNLNDSNWHNLIVANDTSNNTQTVYVDGSLHNSQSLGTGSKLSTSGIFFGKYNIAGDYFFNGNIDQVRIFNKALSSSEVTTLYTENLLIETPTTDTIQLVPDCVAYYKMDGNANDELGTYNGTPTNVSWTQGRFGSAGRFTNTSYINGTSLTDNLPLTFSFWVNPTTSDNAVGLLINKRTTATNGFSITATYNGTLGYPVMGFLNNGGYAGGSDGIATDNLIPSVWNHIVVVVEGSGWTSYVNGAFNNSYSGGLSNSSNQITFGKAYSIGNWVGSDWDLDQVRIFDRAITAQEVTDLYEEVHASSNASFNTVIYSGDNAANRAIGGVGFQPDLVWIKKRNSATLGNHMLFDSVRGADKVLITNLTNAEYDGTGTGYLPAFIDEGFELTANTFVNASSFDYVAWCWKAGGDAVTIPQGTVGNTIASDVSANVDAGFSIVKFTSPSTNTTGFTIGHGLSSAPDLIITKPTDAAIGWHVYSSAFATPSQSYLQLQLTDAALTGNTNIWNNTASTSTVFSMKTGYAIGTSSQAIAYCFHSVAGSQKIGIYDGGTITSSNIVNLGFKPRFVLLKPTQTANDWLIYDNVRDTSDPLQHILYPRSSGAEQISTNDDYNLYTTASGFYFNNTNGFINSSASDVIYLAIA